MSGPIVLVLHGQGQGAALERLMAETGRPVIRVRTDAGAGHWVGDLGEAYEFSGYQEGLGLALRELSAASHPAEATVCITFVNDTLARGHPHCVARGLLAALARPAVHPDAHPGASFAGLHMPLPPAIASVSGAPGYISTWAFSLTAPLQQLGRVRFYGPQEVRQAFAPRWAALPAPYRDWVDRWLMPEDWLRGWYQASPGRPIDEATRQRKRLSIFLEHTLPSRLAALGFQTVDAGCTGNAGQRALLRGLRGLDRLNVNRLKLAHRLPHLLQRLDPRT